MAKTLAVDGVYVSTERRYPRFFGASYHPPRNPSNMAFRYLVLYWRTGKIQYKAKAEDFNNRAKEGILK
jgi:hypothetical protein